MDSTTPSESAAIAKKTFLLDALRGSMSGILDAGWRTFALLIVTRYFDGSSTAKAIVPAAFMIGLLLTPVSNFYFAKTGIRVAKICACNHLLAGLLLAVAGFAQDNLWVFLTSGVLAMALLAQQLPLLVHIYATNYQSTGRGKRLGVSMSLGVGTALPFAYFGGMLLDKDISAYPYLFYIMAIASGLAALCTNFVPSEKLIPNTTRNPLSQLSLAWKDKVFGFILFMWMILGIGNLATLPLQVEYLSQEQYGLMASNAQIALCIGVIPALTRIFTTPIWGYLFDKYNFFTVRAAVSAFILIGMLVFFLADTMSKIYIGSVMYGLSLSGANVNWNLWVTKFAPSGQESTYMSVHTFLTGVRGVIAPFIGFYLLQLFSLHETIYFGATLVGISILLILPISQVADKRGKAIE